MKRSVEGEDRRRTTSLPGRADDHVAEQNPVRAIDAFVDAPDLAGLGSGDVVPKTTGVAGYACSSGGSVRDHRRKSGQRTVGKNFDATGASGPEPVTADEPPPGAHGPRIQARINGRVLRDSNTADMVFPAARLVSPTSEATTLEPGDVVATGTPSGVGCAREPPVWPAPGDPCEVGTEEGIGVPGKPVADEVAAAAARAGA